MEARISFTDRFKKQATEPLTSREKGELRWAKLEEAEQSGELQRVTTRVGLGMLVGMANDMAAYKWVSNLIGRGYIAELPTSIRGEHEYRLIEMPAFGQGRAKKTQRAQKTEIERREQVVRELAAKGTLSTVRSMSELANLIGPKKRYHAIYSWLYNRIQTGWLEAKEIGLDTSGAPIYEFTLPDTPEEKKPKESEEPAFEATDSPFAATNMVEITKGGMTIKLELADYNAIGELVKQLLKGE